MYYHPSFPDWGARITTGISHTTLSRLHYQRNAPSTQQNKDPGQVRGFQRGRGGERRQEEQLQRPDPLAEAAVQQPGQQPDMTFTASSTERGKQAQETESKT